MVGVLITRNFPVCPAKRAKITADWRVSDSSLLRHSASGIREYPRGEINRWLPR